MLYKYEDIKNGFSAKADAVVVGSGAGGAVAAHNLAKAGLKTILLESGPPVGPAQFDHHAPKFLARYYWEGGLRLTGGTAPQPMMQGRMLGGSTVVNSAIMFELPQAVRDAWQAEDGLPFLNTPAVDNSYKRLFKDLNVASTPKKAFGQRNRLVADALRYSGLAPRSLPRAVKNCQGSGDCLTGCSGSRKRSLDLVYIHPAVEKYGLDVYTSCHVEKVNLDGNRATGVTGSIVLKEGRRPGGKFSIEAPIVIVAAGATHTPVILQKSGVKNAGHDLQVHLTGAMFATMEDKVEPWVGAAQGVGAFSREIPGLKYESLWASNSVMSVKLGGFGHEYLRDLTDLQNTLLIAAVYRGKSSGSVKAGWGRQPNPRIRIKVENSEMHNVYRGLHRVAGGLMKAGARYLTSGMTGTKARMQTEEDFAAMLNPKLGFKDISATLNHVFCSTPMSIDPKKRVVEFDGSVSGTTGLYVADASVFPSPSAVNPQATIVMLSDLISRRIAGMADGDYLEQAAAAKVGGESDRRSKSKPVLVA